MQKVIYRIPSRKNRDAFRSGAVKYIFPAIEQRKIRTKYCDEAVNDVLVVHGFSIGYKAEYYILSTFSIVCAASFCVEVVACIWNIEKLCKTDKGH